nr:MAG TPA: hypothetical protein [Caudoviricetes sp.]
MCFSYSDIVKALTRKLLNVIFFRDRIFFERM